MSLPPRCRLFLTKRRQRGGCHYASSKDLYPGFSLTLHPGLSRRNEMKTELYCAVGTGLSFTFMLTDEFVLCPSSDFLNPSFYFLYFYIHLWHKPSMNHFYTIATISASTKVPLGKADTVTQLRAGLPVKYFA